MSAIKTTVYCTVLAEGIHNWVTCPLDEVKYLRSPHRHVFHVKAYFEVNHDDRDVEFIVAKHEIAKWMREKWWDDNLQLLNFGGMSCEMIARDLIEAFGLVKCEVNEDGENGAILEVTN